MSDTASEMPSARPRPRGIRWWPALVIVGLFGGIIALLLAREPADPGPRNLAVQGLLGAGLACLFLWAVGFSRLRLRARLAIVGAAVLAAGVGAATLRSEGVRGDLWLDLRWRWSGSTAQPARQGAAEVNLAAVGPTDYPQFLGPGRDGVAHGIRLARDWSAAPPQELWRHSIGAAWSSYAIVGDFAVTQDQRGGRQHVVCYEIPTGHVVWDAEVPESQPYLAPMGIAGDGPRATPTIADGRVYACDGNGLLSCLEGATGEVLWSARVLEQNGGTNNEWGYSCSPLVVDQRVVVTVGARDGRTLVAYHRDTGELEWTGGHDGLSYSSPILATLAGTRQIVVLNKDTVSSHDPQTGQLLWEHPFPNEESNVANPVLLGGDRLLLTAGYGVGCAAIEVRRGGDGEWTTEELWKNKNLKAKYSNAIVHEGYVYGLDDKILVCLDPATGQRKWKEGRYGYGQVMRVGELLVVQAEPGYVALVEANPEAFREVARLDALAEKTWNNPAIAGQHLLVRNDRETACYRLPLVP